MDAKEVGIRVSYFRELNHLTKNALANLAGVSPTCINDIESGKKCPTIETISYICNFGFKITLPEFFDTNLFKNKDLISTLNDEQRDSLNNFLKTIINK